MIRKLFSLLKRPPSKKRRVLTRDTPLVTQGEYYDLSKLYHAVNDQYFQGELDLQITWAGERDSKPKTRVMFGSFHHQKKLIKIHRRLDQAHVPYFFISFVIYHEMLHHVLPPLKRKKEKRRIHHSSFTEKEKEFQEYTLVMEYRKKMKSTWFAP